MKNLQKGFAPITIVILVMGLLAIGGGFYYFSKISTTISPSSNNENLTSKPTAPITQNPPPQQTKSQAESSCNVKKTDKNIVVYGRVIFPSGIRNSQSYVVTGNDLQSNKINTDGSFCAYGTKGRAAVLLVISQSDDNAFTLGTIINSNEDIHGLFVDNKSTAVALIYMSIVSSQLSEAAEIISAININSDVQGFADKINTTPNLTIKSLEVGGSLTAYHTTALQSVIKSFSTNVPSQSDFTATMVNGAYNSEQLWGTVSSVEPQTLQPKMNRPILFTNETKFINTTKPVGSDIKEYANVQVVGYWDERKSKLFAKTVEIK